MIIKIDLSSRAVKSIVVVKCALKVRLTLSLSYCYKRKRDETKVTVFLIGILAEWQQNESKFGSEDEKFNNSFDTNSKII